MKGWVGWEIRGTFLEHWWRRRYASPPCATNKNTLNIDKLIYILYNKVSVSICLHVQIHISVVNLKGFLEHLINFKEIIIYKVEINIFPPPPQHTYRSVLCNYIISSKRTITPQKRKLKILVRTISCSYTWTARTSLMNLIL